MSAPVRIVHLGLGNFFRAHQAWYTDRAPDAAEWGIAAFTGRSTALADALTAQDGRYTLITRGADRDEARVIRSVVRAHPGTDTAALLDYLARPEVAIVTLTITEAGYRQAPGSGGDSVPARLVAGFAARRAAGAGPITVVSCDNLPDNGAVAAAVVSGIAETVDPDLAGWIREHVSYVTTMVDRITPATAADDSATATALTGWADAAPVVTEPYSEWVLSGTFAAGRPTWEAAGATFVDDIAPYEQRKLWLLNGGHSLLAYAGSARGHRTIADAVADPVCAGWLREWWAEAGQYLPLPADVVADYTAALAERFGNPRMQHLLAQIAADGSQKLPIRILPTIRAARVQGRLPDAALRVLAAWILHLRGAGVPVRDVAADTVVPLASGDLTDAVPAVLGSLGADLAGDALLVQRVLELTGVRTLRR